MTATSTSPAQANGLFALNFIRRYRNRLLEGFPADKWTTQPWPGANHALWIVGHTGLTDDWFRTALAGGEAICPASWNELFGMGSSPQDDPGMYPAPEEVRRIGDRSSEALLAWLAGLDEDGLATPLPEDIRMFGENVGALMSTMAAHEGIHCGQLTCIRKGLGMPPALG